MDNESIEPILAIENLAFSYRDKPVLRDIKLVLHPGHILALLGPNGAGKSTLIRCICGRLQPDAGRLLVAGADPLKNREARAATGLVPQQIALYPHLTVGENLAAFARLAGVKRKAVGSAVAETIEFCDLAAVAGRPVGRLSGGWQRRVNIGCAMSHSPRLLILDEPTVGIDPPAREEIERLLQRLAAAGLAILMTGHDLAQIEILADSVALLSEGRVAATGAPAGLIREFFGESHECRLTLARPPEAGLVEKLGVLGLQADHDKPLHWSGMIDAHTARDLQSRLPDGAPITELRVRRPGLDTLWAHLYGSELEHAA
ncbi:MAG: ABC transporter ATP-binding protein [Wenzhouxiangellaceae bacterium]